MSLRISSLYRYPVKGLSPEALTRATLAPAAYFPGDRLFAIEDGPSGFDPGDPRHQPKTKFLVLMRNEALARLRTRYDDATGALLISDGAGERVRGDLATGEGRDAISGFMRDFLKAELRGEPKVLVAPGKFRFTDSPKGFVSIINLASVAAIEDMVGAPVDPLRFRGNIHVEGIPAWAEFDLVGREIATASGVRLKVTSRIVRCAATNVDPVTAERDLSIPATLMQQLGHRDCGIYAEVVAGGPLAPGERFATVAEQGRDRLPFS